MTNLEIINRFSISLLQQNLLDDLMCSMAENIGELLEFEDCVIYLKEGEVLSQMAAYGDSQRLKQIILNLLSNAVKYNRKGGQINIRTLQISCQTI